MEASKSNDATQLVIRRAEAKDSATIAAFNVAMAFETEGKRLDAAVVHRGVEQLMRRPALGHYYVAECDGHLAGQLMITYEWSDWRDGVFWWIQSVYVHPEYRRRGIFTALYQEVEAQARAAGDVCGIRLYVEHRNESAKRTYECLGMQSSGHLVYEVDWTA